MLSKEEIFPEQSEYIFKAFFINILSLQKEDTRPWLGNLRNINYKIFPGPWHLSLVTHLLHTFFFTFPLLSSEQLLKHTCCVYLREHFLFCHRKTCVFLLGGVVDKDLRAFMGVLFIYKANQRGPVSLGLLYHRYGNEHWQAINSPTAQGNSS